MGAITKTLLGAGAAVAVTAAGGAYYMNNYVIPEELAGNIEASFEDIYNQKEFGTGFTVEKVGDVSVEPTGFMKYDVSLPGFKIDGAVDDIDGIVAGELEAQSFSLTINDKGAALLSGVDKDQTVTATMTSTTPTKGEFILSSDDHDDTIGYNITCDTMTEDVTFQNGRYSVTTSSDSCSMEIVGMEGEKKVLEGSSDMAFTSTVSNMTTGFYDMDMDMSLTDMDVTLDVGYSRKELIEITADSINMAMGYTGLPEGVRDKDPEDLTVKDLPNDFSFSLGVEGLTADADDMMMPKLPVLSAQASFAAQALQSDSANIDFSYGYAIEGLDDLDPFMRPGGPESSSCSFAFGNIPAQSLGETVVDNIKDNDGFGIAGPDIIDDAIDEVEDTDGVSVDLDCAAATGELYNSTLEASHTFKGEAFPGSGKIEVYGLDEAVMELSRLVGPQIMQISAMFQQFSVPTEDGEGLMMEYELDEGGNLSLNGQPLGPVLGR